MTYRLPFLALAIGCAAGATSSAVAQTPAQRTIIEAFRDSLERATDPASLGQLESSLIEVVRRNRTNTLAHLRLGFLALRHGDLGRTRYYEDAATEFQWVTRVAPAWPYGWYGLGLAEFGLARSGVAPAGDAATQRVFAKAAGALARAVTTDSRFTDMLVQEARLARHQREPARAAVMLDALRRAGRSRGTQAQVLAGLGVLEREFGEPAAALEAFEAWAPAAGRLRGLALLEVARTRFLLGRMDGADPYYDGAAFDDSATVRGYRDDLVPIASEAELGRFDASIGASRVRFLRGFWGRRDAADLRRDGERLREHYRRLYHARRAFPGYAPGRLGTLAPAVIAATEQVDDRGLIYIRHGEPDDRVNFTTLGVEPNESWRYRRADHDMLLHFVARHEPDVYRLVESLIDLAGVVPAPSAEGLALESQRREALFQSREGLSPVYRRVRRSSEDGIRQFLIDERAVGRTSLINATTTDGYRHTFTRPLGARHEVAAFPDRGGARLHVAYSVPFAAVGVAWLGQGVPFPLRLRAVVWDLEGNRVAELDSVVRPVTWMSPTEPVLAGMVSFPLPPGRFRVSLALQDGEAVGTVLPVRSVEVLPADSSLRVSDLAIGLRTSPWTTRLGGQERAGLHPLGVFSRQQHAELVYEIAGPAGVPVTAQVTLIRADEGAGVIWSERHVAGLDTGRVVARRPLDLRRVRPGLYRLEVEVTDGRGGLSRRWREFEVAP